MSGQCRLLAGNHSPPCNALCKTHRAQLLQLLSAYRCVHACLCHTLTTAAAADHAAKKAAAAAEKKKAELDVQAQAVWRIGTDQFHRDFRHNICLRVRHLLTYLHAFQAHF
jgi:hypothetical protein